MPEVKPREFTLYSNAYFILYIWVLPTLLTLISVFLFYISTIHPSDAGPSLIIALFPLAGAVIAWWNHVRMPRSILLHADGRIEFVSPLRRVTMTPRDIVTIKPDRRQFGFLVLKHEGGTVKLMNQFNGFHELLTYIEAANPAVELRGC